MGEISQGSTGDSEMPVPHRESRRVLRQQAGTCMAQARASWHRK